MPYSGADFKQAPKEPIDKKTYLKKVSEIKGNVAREFAKENDNHDKKDIELVDQSDCAVAHVQLDKEDSVDSGVFSLQLKFTDVN